MSLRGNFSWRILSSTRLCLESKDLRLLRVHAFRWASPELHVSVSEACQPLMSHPRLPSHHVFSLVNQGNKVPRDLPRSHVSEGPLQMPLICTLFSHLQGHLK